MTLNILVVRPLEAECVQQIKAVSPDIKIIDAWRLENAERRGDFTARAETDALLAQAEIMFGNWHTRNLVARAPRLKWIQHPVAQVDNVAYADVLESPVLLTNASGIHHIQMSELAFTHILMLAKKAPHCAQMQRDRVWEQFIPIVLHGKTLGIVGLGSIGAGVAKLGKAFGMRVVANRRSVKEVTKARNVDVLMPANRLVDLLSQSDFVVITAPATPETRKLIGEKELRAMKPTSYIINIARGSIIDEEALVCALEQGWIAGAGLDTITSEPLSPDSKLWQMPNVILTPHIGGQRDTYNFALTRLFCENLRRYRSGKRLLNLVDKKKGY